MNKKDEGQKSDNAKIDDLHMNTEDGSGEAMTTNQGLFASTTTKIPSPQERTDPRFWRIFISVKK